MTYCHFYWNDILRNRNGGDLAFRDLSLESSTIIKFNNTPWDILTSNFVYDGIGNIETYLMFLFLFGPLVLLIIMKPGRKDIRQVYTACS